MKLSKLNKIALIGASTGGPGHLTKIIRALPAEIKGALIIAQHMNHSFLPGFVKKIGEQCAIQTTLMQKGDYIIDNRIFVVTGRSSVRVENGSLICSEVKSVVDSYNPDIDHLFSSFSEVISSTKVMGVILTGIGDDGVKGCVKLSQKSSVCIAESEKSAVVYGMPQRAKEQVLGVKVLSIDEIAQMIKEFLNDV